MSDILDRIAAYKRREIEAAKERIDPDEMEDRAFAVPKPRGFMAAIRETLAENRPALIAEIKKASPSKGLIRAEFDPAALARAYQEGGATCLSVLTDEPSFQGCRSISASPCGLLSAHAAQGFHVRPLPGVRGPGARRGLHSGDHGGRDGP
jgi:hypothetical protein